MKTSRSRFSIKQANDSKTSFTPLLLSMEHIALLFVVCFIC